MLARPDAAFSPPRRVKRGKSNPPSSEEPKNILRERRFTGYSALVFFIVNYSGKSRKNPAIYFFLLTVWVAHFYHDLWYGGIKHERICKNILFVKKLGGLSRRIQEKRRRIV